MISIKKAMRKLRKNGIPREIKAVMRENIESYHHHPRHEREGKLNVE